MDQIQGVTQDTSGTYCKSPFTLASKESCVLKLNITQAVFGGPIICEQVPNCPNCHLECYQPSPNALLNISQGGAVNIGGSYGGGTVACLNGGLNNLIAATADNSTGVVWAPNNTPTNAMSNTNGAENTAIIVNTLGAGNYAAKICSDYAVDASGNPCTPGSSGCYDDWFLPAGNNLTSSGQLNCLYTNRNAIGNFVNAGYWSSTENNNGLYDGAYFQSFINGNQGTVVKSNSTRVRCVRAFTP